MSAFRTITKEELIEALEDLPDGAQVAFSSDYGDHCHTQQAHELRGNVEQVTLRESAYSDSGWAVKDDEEDWDGPKQEVWVLS